MEKALKEAFSKAVVGFSGVPKAVEVELQKLGQEFEHLRGDLARMHVNEVDFEIDVSGGLDLVPKATGTGKLTIKLVRSPLPAGAPPEK